MIQLNRNLLAVAALIILITVLTSFAAAEDPIILGFTGTNGVMKRIDTKNEFDPYLGYGINQWGAQAFTLTSRVQISSIELILAAIAATDVQVDLVQGTFGQGTVLQTSAVHADAYDPAIGPRVYSIPTQLTLNPNKYYLVLSTYSAVIGSPASPVGAFWMTAVPPTVGAKVGTIGNFEPCQGDNTHPWVIGNGCNTDTPLASSWFSETLSSSERVFPPADFRLRGTSTTCADNDNDCLCALEGADPSTVTCVNGQTDDGKTFALLYPKSNWTQELLVYAHPGGEVFRYAPPVFRPDFHFRDNVLNEGVAVGYFIEAMPEEVGAYKANQVKDLFTTLIGPPIRTYISGCSIGSLSALDVAENFPTRYDGAVLYGALLDGIYGADGFMADARLLLKYFYGSSPAYTMPELFKVPPSFPQCGSTVANLFNLGDPGDPLKIATVLGITYFPPDLLQQALISNICMSVGFEYGHHAPFLWEIPYDNTEKVYGGLSDAENADLNANIERITGDPLGMKLSQDHYTPTGNIVFPVVTFRNRLDPSLPMFFQDDYAKKVGAAGHSMNLLQMSSTTSKVMHCTFDPAEQLGAFETLVSWVRNGMRAPLLSIGSDVQVTPEPGITLTFDNVTSEGIATATELSNPSPPPPNIRIVSGKSYDITFTGEFNGNATVCISYNISDLSGNESNLRLMHWENQDWRDITTSLDTVNHVICGVTTSFSEFALMELTPNTPPKALCRDAIVLTQSGLCIANASVDGGSFDPAGDSIILAQSPQGPYPIGNSAVTLTVTDTKGASSECTGTVTVLDKTPPTINNISVTPSVLWPPKHKMVNVTVNYNAADNCGQPACQIISVASNEPISSSDYAVVDAHHVKLSADRLGSGTGRTYTITVICVDTSGNTSGQAVMVRVPHDQGGK